MGEQDLTFYVAAHQDDWVLFQGEVAYRDLRRKGDTIVFIYTTAGQGVRSEVWWRAREYGALEAVRSVRGGTLPEEERVVVSGHPIAMFRGVSTVSYFMRLPDGNHDGQGFPNACSQSLEKLRLSDERLEAVDHSTGYASWEDFCTTLRALVAREADRARESRPLIHAPDHDTGRNPGDHSDHYHTAAALRTLDGAGFRWAWWQGYGTRTKEANLGGRDAHRKMRLFLNYNGAAFRQTVARGEPFDEYAAFKHHGDYDAWFRRSYVTLE